jgi:hypothetical protein
LRDEGFGIAQHRDAKAQQRRQGGDDDVTMM